MRKVIGNRFRIDVSVYDIANGFPKDPSVLKFIMDKLPYTAPAAPPLHEYEFEYGVDPEIIRDGEGRFHVDIAPDEEGTWAYRWFTEELAPGDILYAKEGAIDVLPSKLV
jgi:hypothetical protein